MIFIGAVEKFNMFQSSLAVLLFCVLSRVIRIFIFVSFEVFDFSSV